MVKDPLNNSKVGVIGFDGLDYKFFNEINNEKYNIVPLYSPVPMTGPAWTSVYTGLSVTNHKIKEGWGRKKSHFYSKEKIIDDLIWNVLKFLGNLGLKEKVKEYITYSNSECDYLWDILSIKGIKCKLFNLPCTFPPRKIKGFHIAGFPIRKNRNFCYPSGLVKELPKDFYKKSDLIQLVSNPYKDGMGDYKTPLQKIGFDKVIELAEKHSFELLDCFLELEDYPFEMIQFSFVDRIAHVFGLSDNVTKVIYELVRDILEYLDNHKEYDNIFIISDHGFRPNGPIHGHTYYGTFAWRGKDLKEEFDLRTQITVKDVAPTILAIYDLTFNCDGRIIYEILKDFNIEELPEKSFLKSSEHTEDENIKEELEDRLKNLGYF